MVIIAITGGIGSGKSTVSQILEKEYKYPVVSCDEVYSELLTQKSFIEYMKTRLPWVPFDGDILNRRALSNIVFNDIKKMKELRRATKDIIFVGAINKMYSIIPDHYNGKCFFEVPLLFEDELIDAFNAAIVVMRDQEKRIEAAMKRNNLTLEEVLNRLDSQIEYETYSYPEDCYFVYNNGTIDELRDQVARTVAKLDISIKW